MTYLARTLVVSIGLIAFANLACAAPEVVRDTDGHLITLVAGHASLKKWVLPDVPYPADNKPTAERIELGKKLFFDPRVSGEGNMSCATCHNPVRCFSDGLPTAKGVKSMVLGRATPTIWNAAYNTLQMWDGRKKSLEHQALGPIQADVEMNADMTKLLGFLNESPGYKGLFEKVYPNLPINDDTLGKAIASFERTIISRNTPFDQWVAGKKGAMTADQVSGFKIFISSDKANCAACHMGPNFTDNGFHNVGLQSFGAAEPDLGRFKERALPVNRGAFKTPTLREAVSTGPYFHDGSARTLEEVVAFYAKAGEVRTNQSKTIKGFNLTDVETRQLVSFLHALTTQAPPAVTLPTLPN